MLGLFGAVGAIGQLAVLAGMFAHSRDQERSADRIGLDLMHKAGYDPSESARIWQNLLEEMKAKMKPKKSNISAEMLDTANTYDDKVALVRMIVAEDTSRVASVLKGMIKSSM